MFFLVIKTQYFLPYPHGCYNKTEHLSSQEGQVPPLYSAGTSYELLLYHLLRCVSFIYVPSPDCDFLKVKKKLTLFHLNIPAPSRVSYTQQAVNKFSGTDKSFYVPFIPQAFFEYILYVPSIVDPKYATIKKKTESLNSTFHVTVSWFLQ